LCLTEGDFLVNCRARKPEAAGWGRSALVLSAAIAVFIVVFPAAGWAQELEFGGELELRGTYDTNVLRTAEDYDFELRRHDVDETELDDFYGALKTKLHLKMPFNDVYEQTLRYSLEGNRYADLTDERRERHRLGFEPTVHLSRSVDLMLEYELEVDNRDRKAEYLRPDSLQNRAGAMLRWKIDPNNQLSFGYRFEDQDYESLEDTPFDDYQGHQAWLGYAHRFSKRTRGTIDLRYRTRDYEEDTRDELGNGIPGKDRVDDRYEIEARLTHLFTPKMLGRIGYLYRNHESEGTFYDYDLHRLHGIWVQQFPWQLRLQTYLHYEWRDYADQRAQDTRVNPISGEPFQEFSDEDRADEQLFFLFSVTKELGKGFSCGAEFQYLNSESNDESSEYESQSYSLFVRYRF